MATRVMVINDTQEILELFQEILEQEGYEVILYSYAPNELQEIERHQPELLILDVIFGAEKNGLAIAPKTAHAPVDAHDSSDSVHSSHPGGARDGGVFAGTRDQSGPEAL